MNRINANSHQFEKNSVRLQSMYQNVLVKFNHYVRNMHNIYKLSDICLLWGERTQRDIVRYSVTCCARIFLFSPVDFSISNHLFSNTSLPAL